MASYEGVCRGWFPPDAPPEAPAARIATIRNSPVFCRVTTLGLEVWLCTPRRPSSSAYGQRCGIQFVPEQRGIDGVSNERR